MVPMLAQMLFTKPGVQLPLAVAMKLVDEFGLGAAVLLTILGMVMHWHLPRHRMSMEERVKDGKISENEANRRVAFFGRCALLTTISGVAVLVLVLLDFNG
jgi:predicted permease